MTETQADSQIAGSEEKDPSPRMSPIVVGVDGSSGSMAALRWAVQEAELRGVAVHAVMAWEQLGTIGSANVWGPGMDPSFDTQKILAAGAADKAARLSEEAGRGHDVPMTWEAVEGHPAFALTRVAENSELLVVGSRGHGGFVGALLGSVSQHVVAHARCPVVVVPGAERRNGSNG